MKLFSYVVRLDFGFAPNPFYGVCTLATCKGQIRKAADVGDWVIGTGASANGLKGHLVYAMNVSEKLTFEQYWADPRFVSKRPYLRGSIKQTRGDNIYHRDLRSGEWIQENSRHSDKDGNPEPKHIARDTRHPFVLISVDFYYWGGAGPLIPTRFRNWQGHDICQHRAMKYKFPAAMTNAFIVWIRSSGESKFIGQPTNFD